MKKLFNFILCLIFLLGVTFVLADVSSVVLNSPSNNAYDPDGDLTFSCTVNMGANNSTISSLSLYHNMGGTFAANQTNSTAVSNATAYTFSVNDVANGAYTWNCYACDNNSLCKWASSNYTINVNSSEYAKYDDLDSCEEGEVGNLDITIKEPDDNDDFNINDEMDIEVKVENDANEDLDIVVEATLYNKDEDEETESVKSDEIEVNEDDSETFDLTLEIPKGADEDDDYILYIKAYEDGNEDDHCEEDDIDVDIKREKHSVVIDKFTLTPSTASCGEDIEVKVEIENIGTSDEDGIYVEIENSELGISETSAEYDLEDYDSADNDAIIRFSIQIPENIEVKDYTITATVYFDDGDESKEETKILKVGSCEEKVTITEETAFMFYQTTIEAEQGKTASIPIKITNIGGKAATYDIDVTNAEEFAKPFLTKSVVLEAGQTSTVYVYLKTKEDVDTGKYSATISLRSGTELLKTETITVDVKEKAEEKSTFTSALGKFAVVFWIILDVLIVAGIVFLVMKILKFRKKKI